MKNRNAKTDPRPLRPRVIFVSKFVGALVVLYALIAWNPVNDHVIVPLTEGITRSTAVVLRAFDNAVVESGTVIRSSQFAIDVKNGCNGVEAAILLAAAMFAFPTTVRSRAAGLVAGVIAIQLLNVVRLSTLFWLGENHRRLFDLFHVAVWQSIVILAAISIFVLWSLKFAEKPLAHSR